MRGLGLSVSSAPVPFRTAVGSGEGFLLQGDVGTIFTTDPRQQSLSFDWVVTPDLNDRDFGLVALRDIVHYLFIRAEGGFEWGPQGEPTELLILELIPQRPHGGSITRRRVLHRGVPLRNR